MAEALLIRKNYEIFLILSRLHKKSKSRAGRLRQLFVKIFKKAGTFLKMRRLKKCVGRKKLRAGGSLPLLPKTEKTGKTRRKTMKNEKKLLIFAFLAIFALALAACGARKLRKA